MDGRPHGIQMTQFGVVRGRSSTAASIWCRKSRRFRKKRSCWFAEVRQRVKSTDTLSVRSSSLEFVIVRRQLHVTSLLNPKRCKSSQLSVDVRKPFKS